MEVTDRSEQGNGTLNESVVDSMATPVVPLMSHTELQVALTYIFSLAIPVCIFGLCSNVVNIIVFYRMGFSIPTNISLFSLAIADWLTLAISTVVVFGRHPAFQTANLMSMRDVTFTVSVAYPGVSQSYVNEGCHIHCLSGLSRCQCNGFLDHSRHQCGESLLHCLSIEGLTGVISNIYIRFYCWKKHFFL